jgi:hypothetical protein
MSEKCHGHADTFSQNKHNIYGYTDSKGLKMIEVKSACSSLPFS